MIVLGNLVNVAVVNQINTQAALNLALFSPGAVQTIVQQAGNGAALNQGK